MRRLCLCPARGALRSRRARPGSGRHLQRDPHLDQNRRPPRPGVHQRVSPRARSRPAEDPLPRAHAGLVAQRGRQRVLLQGPGHTRAFVRSLGHAESGRDRSTAGRDHDHASDRIGVARGEAWRLLVRPHRGRARPIRSRRRTASASVSCPQCRPACSSTSASCSAPPKLPPWQIVGRFRGGDTCATTAIPRSRSKGDSSSSSPAPPSRPPSSAWRATRC